MSAIEQIQARLPDAAKDIRLNLHAVLSTGSLPPADRWGVAVASAIAARNPALYRAVLSDAQEAVPAGVIDDAQAAAAVMAMNNVYYRFRHMVQKPSYAKISPRLRMNRLGQPATTKVTFELFALAVSAIHGCETCIRAHEQAVALGGLSEEQVNDAVRIAATIYAAAIALEMGPPDGAK